MLGCCTFVHILGGVACVMTKVNVQAELTAQMESHSKPGKPAFSTPTPHNHPIHTHIHPKTNLKPRPNLKPNSKPNPTFCA